MKRLLGVLFLCFLVVNTHGVHSRQLSRPSYFGQDLHKCAGGNKEGDGGYSVHEVGAGAGVNQLFAALSSGSNSDLLGALSAPTPQAPIKRPQEQPSLYSLYAKEPQEEEYLGKSTDYFASHALQRRETEDFSNDHDEYVPVIGRDGVPLDTPEVRKAKEQHLQAHAEARASKNYPVDTYDDKYEGKYAEPIVDFKIHYPDEHIPLIGINGVPVETLEVKFAKKQHFDAHEEVRARNLQEEFKKPSESAEEYDYENNIEREAPTKKEPIKKEPKKEVRKPIKKEERSEEKEEEDDGQDRYPYEHYIKIEEPREYRHFYAYNEEEKKDY